MNEKLSADPKISSSDKQPDSQSDVLRPLSPEEVAAVAGGPIVQNRSF